VPVKTYYDRSPLGFVEKTPQGYLKFDAVASRTGIFLYHQPDGSVRRAYRSPEEIFSADSLASFRMMPIINDHEMGRTPKITADNVKQFQIGTIGENVRGEGNLLKLAGIIQDKSGVDAVDNGRRGLSLAYESNDINEPGVTADGQEYDYRQTQIRGNHLAIVDRGRAGPIAALNMDTADIDLISEPIPQQSKKERRMKYNLDGCEVDAPESVINALVKARTDLAAATTDFNTQKTAAGVLKSNLDTASAERDAARAEVTTLKAVDTAKLVADGVAARIALVDAATLICDAAELKGKTDSEIRIAVIKKVWPDLSMDGKDPVYVSAMFDAAVKAGDTEQRRKALASQRQTAMTVDKDGKGLKENAQDPQAANKLLQDAWKQDCSVSAKKK